MRKEGIHMQHNEKKKAYEKPAIIYSKKIEVISAVCNSAWGPGPGCKTPGKCVRIRN